MLTGLVLMLGELKDIKYNQCDATKAYNEIEELEEQNGKLLEQQGKTLKEMEELQKRLANQIKSTKESEKHREHLNNCLMHLEKEGKKHQLSQELSKEKGGYSDVCNDVNLAGG